MSALKVQTEDRFVRAFDNLPTDSGMIHSLRDAGMKSFRALGLPTPHDEAWRYTSLNEMTSVADAAVIDASGGVVALSPPAGIRIRPLSQVLADDPALASLLGSVVACDALTALNQAFLGDGLWIDVPDDFSSGKPLVLLTTAQGNADRHPRIMLRMGARSFLRIIETQSIKNLHQGRVCNTVFEATLSEGAELVHSRMQEGGSVGSLISRVGIRLLRDSKYNSFVVTLGGAKIREDLRVILEGKDAHCDLHGLTLGFSNDHIDHHTSVEHCVPHTSSKQAYRAIVGEHATSVYNGRIFVEHDAQKTDAKQSSRNLILSQTATANSKPELEIYADDVKCAHGCTVGRLDDDAMFYLRSRGLSSEQAMRMLTFAFADEVLDADASGRVHAWLEQRFGVLS